jgi:hypothetical protein
MKFHLDPEPAKPGNHLLTKYGYDRQVQAWINRLDDGELLSDQLTEEQLLFVCTEVTKRRIGKARNGRLADTDLRRHTERAVAKTTPLISTPDLDKPLSDIELLLALPEMREWWADVERIRHTEMGNQNGGFKANYAGTLAVMVRMAIAGISPHVDDNLDALARDNRQRELFGWAHASAMADVLDPASVAALPESVAVPSPGRFSELSERLALPVIVACKHATMVMLRELEALLHDEGRLSRKEGVLDDLMVDGTDWPAWVPQKGGGGKGSARDLRYRAHAPEAGYRAYARASGRGGGKVDVVGSTTISGRTLANHIFKDWRGYYLNIMASHRLQLPVQATGFDAAIDETKGLVPLLSDVHKYGQEAGWTFDVRRLTGDSAYDTSPNVRLCEVNYGIAPSSATPARTSSARSRSPPTTPRTTRSRPAPPRGS